MKNLSALVLAVLIGVPAAAHAQKVNTDFDSAADFTAYKTYVYKPDMVARSPLMDKRIVEGIAANLTTKGLAKVESNPDVYVSYHGSVSEEVSIDTNNWGYGYGAGWRWGGYYGPTSTSTQVRKYERGTLVVDIWDAKKNQLVWRGIASDTISDKPEKNEQKIKKALEKMFKKYPPQVKDKK